MERSYTGKITETHIADNNIVIGYQYKSIFIFIFILFKERKRNCQGTITSKTITFTFFTPMTDQWLKFKSKKIIIKAVFKPN